MKPPKFRDQPEFNFGETSEKSQKQEVSNGGIMKAQLIVLWRNTGEETKTFRTIREAKAAMEQLDFDHGNKIIKMELMDAE